MNCSVCSKSNSHLTLRPMHDLPDNFSVLGHEFEASMRNVSVDHVAFFSKQTFFHVLFVEPVIASVCLVPNFVRDYFFQEILFLLFVHLLHRES